jgi:hypothetical protein
MTDPNRSHAFRRRSITGTNFPEGSLQGGGNRINDSLYWQSDMQTVLARESRDTCDVCGGSRSLFVHLPKRLPVKEAVEADLFGGRKRYLEWKAATR